MKDYHLQQFDPRIPSSSRDCAASTTGMDIYFGTRGAAELTTAQVRHQSGISPIPGVDTPSGGLPISAIERVCKAHGVGIEFGRATTSFYRRWTTTELRARLSTYYGGHMLGDYDQVPIPWRAHGSTFQGGHSAWAHDYRTDLPDARGNVGPTVCWHDPLRKRPIRLPFAVLVAYNQKPGSPIRGFAGWVKIPAIPGGTYAKPMPDRTRTDFATVAVHRDRTKGAASTVRVIRGKGTLVELRMYAEGERYRGEATWGALSLLGNDWINLGRLRKVGGET